MKLIECILLVDDSPSTNFYNKKIIEVQNLTDKIHEVGNGLEALDYLNNEGKFQDASIYTKPNIIFLDINMPKMDGFEFIEAYQKLPEAKRAEILVVFLTTSNWSKDKAKAINNDIVFDFIEKPLKPEALKKIKEHYIFLKSQFSSIKLQA